MKKLIFAAAFVLLTGCAAHHTQARSQCNGNIIRQEPLYPAKAVARNIKGVVKVRYTYGLDGAVENVAILSAEPPEIFNREVITAMKKWCGKPGTTETRIFTPLPLMVKG
ncbi:TonB family protein [Scandinavium sp. TWS1a]|uniref:TonB family protein n=1 Tax=Scandinavium tedordense TaxID=2926521 RepID=UPI00216644CD|nr:TonB family protein [Scandinavium tedordense]MCS2172634.1 TonB family protein [Scandinavium tedordense]